MTKSECMKGLHGRVRAMLDKMVRSSRPDTDKLLGHDLSCTLVKYP